MTGSVFLIRKDNLFLIGRTKNIEKQMKEILPDEVIATLETDYPLAFEARLLRRYRQTRLPKSSYFKFTDKQLKDCKKQFGLKGSIPRTIGEEFFIALTASILLLVFSVLIVLQFNHIVGLAFSVGFAMASFPMLLLFCLGNFGGYNCSDLQPFSSWFNRVRAILVALTLLSLSFLLCKRYL